MKNDDILTVKETAALLKTTRQQVRKMIANEELPAVKVGREWRVLKAGIMEFFEENLRSLIVRNACKVIYNAITNALCQFVTVFFRFHTRILIRIA